MGVASLLLCLTGIALAEMSGPGVYSPPQARIVHSGQACNYNNEGYSERIYTIREGDTLELTCLVTGHPRPQQVRWTKTAGIGSDRFLETTVFNETLRITHIQRQQGGRYYCRAENGIGQPAIRSFRVEVYYLDTPVLTVHQSVGDAKEYYQERTVFLRCSGNSSPPALFTWRRDGQPLRQDLDAGITIYEPLFTQGETKILKLKNLRASDYATYSCVASVRNVCDLPDRQADFRLTNMTAAPSIRIRGPDALIVNPEETVSLQCEVLGGWPRPSLSWARLGGQPLPPGARVVRGNLTLPRVSGEHAGSYQCSASNGVGGSVRKSITIIVRTLRQGRFWITPDPYHEDVNIQIGREVKISCQVEAIPQEELSYMWHKNGRALRSTERMVISSNDADFQPGTSSLDIIDLKFTDFGTYTCVASLGTPGSAGIPDISIDVNISSSTVPPSVSVPKGRSAVTAQEGRPAELQCAVSGKPKPVLLWSRADRDAPMPDGSMRSVSYDGSLRLANVTRDMAGVYRCQTDRYNGFNVPPREASITLNVHYPPQVDPPHSEVRQALGRSVSLRCSVLRASPARPLLHEWLLGDRVLTSGRLETPGEPWDIERLSRSSYGTYNFTVLNEAGAASCLFTLTGRAYPPEFFFDTASPVRSTRGDTYSYELQWTQMNPDAVDQVTSYKLEYRQVGQGRWDRVEVTVRSVLRRGDLISHTLSDLTKPRAYEVRLTPVTAFGDGDSASRILRYYEAPTLSPQTGDASCGFEDESLCGFSLDPNGNFNWTRQSAATRSPKFTPNTGPLADRAGSKTGRRGSRGFFMFIETSRPRNLGDRARLLSPVYHVTPPRTSSGLSAFCLYFYYHMYGKHIGSLNIYVRSPGALDTQVWTRGGNQGDTWHRANVTITPPGPFQLIVEGIRGSGVEGDIAIDDVTVVDGNCEKPSISSGEAKQSQQQSLRNVPGPRLGPAPRPGGLAPLPQVMLGTASW
ncbi:MAM domain-containing glycosylphosphatidylinositol anchor protein 2-like [Lampetra planeri]